MRKYSLIELFHLSQEELFGLYRWFSSHIDMSADDLSVQRIAASNLRKVRRVLAMRRFPFG